MPSRSGRPTSSAAPTDEFRSTNGQLQWIINEALRKSGRLKKAKKRPADEDPADEAEGKTPEKE